MKVKKVNRYYCDYCKKSKGTSAAMVKHEKHCTMNPHRECRMCDFAGTANDLTALLAMIPKDILVDGEITGFPMVANEDEILAAFKKVRSEASDCPACILAVIRQSKTQVMVPFDYEKEKRSFWDAANAENYQPGCVY